MTNSSVWQCNRSVEPIRQPESEHVRHERKRTAATSSSGSNAKTRRSVAGADRVDRGKASDDWDRSDCGAAIIRAKVDFPTPPFCATIAIVYGIAPDRSREHRSRRQDTPLSGYPPAPLEQKQIQTLPNVPGVGHCRLPDMLRFPSGRLVPNARIPIRARVE